MNLQHATKKDGNRTADELRVEELERVRDLIQNLAADYDRADRYNAANALDRADQDLKHAQKEVVQDE
jgi:hypothetical protein